MLDGVQQIRILLLYARKSERYIGSDWYFQLTWNDSDVNLPSKSMVPLNVSCFFDAERDGTAMGACGGVTYQIVGKDSVIQGYGEILILEILYVVY